MEEYWQVFTDLKRQGKIRAAGLSNHDICQLEAAESAGNVDAIQPPFNLIHRDAADDVLLWARRARVRGDRLQPHGFGPAHRCLQRRTGGQSAAG